MSILNKTETESRSVGLGPLYGALAKARAEFSEIPRNRVATIRMKSGGQYSYRYADLADVMNATTPALAAHGVTVMQYPEDLMILTILAHESGAEKCFRWPIKALPQRSLEDSQSFQSAVQVAKRYALTAALGISTEETIEGDEKAHKTIHHAQEPQGDAFITADGVRAPIGAKITERMSKRDRAAEAARAIETLFDGPKTRKGLEGVWSRNERFIEVFKAEYDDLFQNVYDAFNAKLYEIEGEGKVA